MGRICIFPSAKTFKAVARIFTILFFLFSLISLNMTSAFGFPGLSGLKEYAVVPLTPTLSPTGRGNLKDSEIETGIDLNPILVVTPSPFSSTQPRIKLPEEPDEFDEREVDAYYDWRSDMFYRKFNLTGKGDVDYMTARRTYKVWLDDFGTPVVITVADPLFYWIDLNANGKFEQDKGEMWSDPYEDGLTGNEKVYDSSDLQTPPSEIPLWSAPDTITP